MKKKSISTILVVCALSILGCSEDKGISAKVDPTPNNKPEEPTVVETRLAYGADISWLTAQEKQGIKFYNAQGIEKDMFALIPEMGGNAVRFRVWVNPSKDLYSGLCDKAATLALAKRAQAAGLRIMIDFHYSDSWADPGKQNKPAAWKNMSVDEMANAIAEHTTDVLTALKEAEIDVEWVQIGNETTDGMLWEEGRCSKNPKNYALFIKSGAEAAKAVYDKVKVIVHIDNGWLASTLEWNIGELVKAGVKDKFDVIGVSYYPSYLGENDKAKALGISSWKEGNKYIASNVKRWEEKYGKKVMVVEYGYRNDQLGEAQECLSDLMAKTKDYENFEGILMWEPQSYNGWANYGLGLFTKDGKPGVVFK